MERREFLAGAAALTASIAVKDLALPGQASAVTIPAGQVLVTQLWSRHLQWVSTRAEADNDPFGTGVKVGQTLQQCGFSSVDLTVRSDGHVRPELVKTNLPPMLAGIRSTGAICNMIGVNFSPPTDPSDVSWLSPAGSPGSQFVHEILSVAGANGIKMYRFNNTGGGSFPNNTFGPQMWSILDQYRLSLRRLAQVNAQYGGLCGVAHTHGSNFGTTVEPYTYAMQGIDPKLIGINLAIGHVATSMPGAGWQIPVRHAMPNIRSFCPEDLRATVNPTTGALSITRAQPPGPSGTGNGVINWTTMYQLLRLGGYSGPAESQIEYTLPDIPGTGTWNFNNANFADTPAFANAIAAGRISPAYLIDAMKHDSDFIRARAVAAGWTSAQVV